MDYRRYAIGSLELRKWVVCNECGTPDKPSYVWQSNDREQNFALVVNAVMLHELTAHASTPHTSVKRK